MKSPGEIVKNNLRLGLFLKLKTMSYNNTIEWNQAQADSIAQHKRDKRHRELMIDEYLDSTTDLFSSRDFYYYSEETGKSMKWLFDNSYFKQDIVEILRCANLDDDQELINLIHIHLL